MPLPAYADWKAPKSDGALLVWPESELLSPAIARNGASLGNLETPILGVPAHELRAATRIYLGHDSAGPLIVTGHQAELHHPGVWIKSAVIHAIAEKTGGKAIHLAVDTDAPKHLTFKYPLDAAGRAVSDPITDDENLTTANWAGLLTAPSPTYITKLEAEFRSHASNFGFTPAADEILASLRRSSLDPVELPRATTAAIHELDWSLGLRYDAVMASPLWGSEPFALFAGHLLANAAEYAAAYNSALADYRSQENITTPGRPMPDLAVTAAAIELPLWLDDLNHGTRTRASATLKNGRWGLDVSGERFEPSSGWETARDLVKFCRRHNHRLAPRALTLTTFCRLFLADLFVHGIGGGRYDQVTDRTLLSFFNVQPPAFAIATATLFHPWAANRTRACLPCVHQQGHHLTHSVINKTRYLQAITAAPRHSHERKAAYLAMHADLAATQPAAPELAAWRELLATTESAAAADKFLFDRELFYALQPRERLQQMIAAVTAEVG